MEPLSLADGRELGGNKPLIMGILNVTPDSFSDGGRWLQTDAAVAHGLEMARDGADMIDVGGESTRPGSRRVETDEQIRRVLTPIHELRRQLDNDFPQVAISIDTTRSAVAETALQGGAAIINDISAGDDDPAILTLAGRCSVPIILMHKQGEPATMQQQPQYDDVVAQVRTFLLQRAAQALAAGITRSKIIIDPGIGFGKTRDHNLQLLCHLDQLVATGYPVLLGASRKRFMGAICQSGQVLGMPGVPGELAGTTCATTALGVVAGVTILRVHDVRFNRQAADVTWAIRQASSR